jgi:hypothetical protein
LLHKVILFRLGHVVVNAETASIIQVMMINYSSLLLSKVILLFMFIGIEMLIIYQAIVAVVYSNNLSLGLGNCIVQASSTLLSDVTLVCMGSYYSV